LREVVVLIGVIAASIIILSLSACDSGPPRKQIDLERRENSKATVQGHEVVTRSYSQEAYSVFFGGWVDDPVPLVRQTGVQFGASQYSEVSKLRERLAEGRFVAPGGQQCWSDVSRYRARVDPGDTWDLSRQQREAIVEGTHELLIIRTACQGST
jgi:hypothetical protein